MNTNLNFAIALEKKYNEKFVTAPALDIVKDTMGFAFRAVVSTQS